MSFSIARQRFSSAIQGDDANIDLAYAALCIAQEEYPDLVPETYLAALDDMAARLAAQMPRERYPLRVLQAINRFLFDELGFRGNEADYYDPRNSFLNQVLERRTGIPISLSLVYLELAQRIGFPMQGVGMPGHFIVRPRVEDMQIYVDPFNKGEILFMEDCQRRLEALHGQPLEMTPEMLPEVSSRQFLTRMLTNLKIIYIQREAFGKALAAVERLLLLSPDQPIELRDRGLLLYELEQWHEAIAPLQRYIELRPDAQDAVQIYELIQDMQR